MDDLKALTKSRIIGLLQAIRDLQVDIQLIYASLGAFQKTMQEVDPAIEQVFQRHLKEAIVAGVPPGAHALIDAIDRLTLELQAEGWTIQ